MEIRIFKDEDEARKAIEEDGADVRGYSDGSGYKGGVGAAAVLYVGEEEVQTLRFRLGSDLDHEVYEAECVGLILSLHLARLQRQPIHKLSLWLDNTSSITASDTDKTGSAHYLLDFFHEVLIETRQDHPNIIISIAWVPGHSGILGNERADQEAKQAAPAATNPNSRYSYENLFQRVRPQL